jgi:RNA polymerase sigma-32 factor
LVRRRFTAGNAFMFLALRPEPAAAVDRSHTVRGAVIRGSSQSCVLLRGAAASTRGKVRSLVTWEEQETLMAQLAGVGRQFVKAAMAAPFLEREEERALAVRWREDHDERALHRLAQAHMRLVIALAARFRHYGLSVADLIQEGHVGLLEAAARFEPTREVRFSTYATWWIRASMQDYILRNWSIVRGGTSSAQKALFFNLRRLRVKLSREAGVPNSTMFGTIARALGVSTADVELMDLRLSGPDVSLNTPVFDGESSSPRERVETLIDSKPLPDELVSEMIDSGRRSDWLRDALTVLSERELRILRERQLVEQAATLEALGGRLGISKERVRQIENRALEKLRRVLTERHPAESPDAFV